MRSMAHLKKLDIRQKKLDNRSISCVFVGYPKWFTGYTFYSIYITLIENKDIKFLEALSNENINPLVYQLDNEWTNMVEDDLIWSIR